MTGRASMPHPHSLDSLGSFPALLNRTRACASPARHCGIRSDCDGCGEPLPRRSPPSSVILVLWLLSLMRSTMMQSVSYDCRVPPRTQRIPVHNGRCVPPPVQFRKAGTRGLPRTRKAQPRSPGAPEAVAEAQTDLPKNRSAPLACPLFDSWPHGCR